MEIVGTTRPVYLTLSKGLGPTRGIILTYLIGRANDKARVSFTYEHIATVVGVSRMTVSRTMAFLESEGFFLRVTRPLTKKYGCILSVKRITSFISRHENGPF